SAATGLSRIAGLVREIVASSYFATSGAFSAFTIAFQVPNLVRSLFADAALSAAFVPVFTELLEHGKRREAFRLASTLLVLIVARPFFHGQQQLYAYAIGVLLGTVVQLAMALPMLRRVGFRFDLHFDPRDPRVGLIFKLMLPVTIGLGVINFDLLINSTLGS